MADRLLVPPDFDVTCPPSHPAFRFDVLGPEHNVADLDAWSSSIDHIRSTPGFPFDGWPDRPYSPAENLVDLKEHRRRHQRRVDFAWSVLDPADPTVVVGCIYLKPDPTGTVDAVASSWVRLDRAPLDNPLRRHLAPWFASGWPIAIRYESDGPTPGA
jgi:hypothetical protein